MAAIVFVIDGAQVAPADADWFARTPCGCVSGCILAEGYDGEILATEDQAWKAYEPNATFRKRRRAAGVILEIGLRSKVTEYIKKCPHTPAYGMPQRPTPTGWTWAAYGYGHDSKARTHLVRTAEAETTSQYPEKFRSLCGRAESRWYTDRLTLHDTPECTRCWNAGGRMTEEDAAGGQSQE